MQLIFRPSVFILIIFLVTKAPGQTLTITPTTTLTAQRSNNTSAANSFLGLSNGNLKASNISKVSVRELMYPGATTKIFARLMPWWGTSSHINIGYDSADPAQVKRQLTDMMSRGIHGTVIDWYGPDKTHHNTVAINVMKDAELRHGLFDFALSYDHAALKSCAATAGCSVTSKIISHLNYAWKTFQQSAAYLKKNGRPVVFFFGTENYSIDWGRVRASVLGSPYFVFRNTSGFSKPQSDGAFAWIGEASSSTDMALSYLDYFYSTSLKTDADIIFGSGYKGFNDTLASWGKDRIVKQQCGQTFLASMRKNSEYYSSARQLEFLQLVTWNDYEEGTSVESGIDNCVSISATLSNGSLSWTLNGRENTVHHFIVYVSKDGESLMRLSEMRPSARSLNVSSYSLASGNYVFYVQAVGQPMMLNHISGGIKFSVAAPTSTAGLTITSPTAESTLSSPVTINATARSSSNIVAVATYIDDVLYAKSSFASATVYYTKSVTAAKGYRRFTVQAWDSKGNIYKQTRYINVR